MPLSHCDAFCTSGNSPTSLAVADAFCTSGTSPTVRVFGPPDAPPLLVLGGISATSDLAWWSDIVGPRRPIDSTRYRIISADWSLDSQVTTTHQASRLLDTLDTLGVSRLHTTIGCSYGGMVALALGELAPHRVGQLVVFGATHRPHPLATAWRWVQRQVADLGEGGLALARALAMTTYRSDRELDARFADDPEALVDWLEHHGRRFTERFTVESFTALSGAIDRHRVTPEAITAPTTVVGFDTDLLAPPWLVAELVQRLPRAHRVEITTPYGHDAFLKETAAVGRVLGHTLCARKEVAA